MESISHIDAQGYCTGGGENWDCVSISLTFLLPCRYYPLPIFIGNEPFQSYFFTKEHNEQG